MSVGRQLSGIYLSEFPSSMLFALQDAVGVHCYSHYLESHSGFHSPTIYAVLSVTTASKGSCQGKNHTSV